MTQTTPKKSRFGCIPILGAVIVLAAGGAYLYFGNPLGKELTPTEGAQVIPQEATLTSFISTNSQHWSKLSNFGTPDAQKFVTDSVKNLQQEINQNIGIDYEKDIQPWVGNIMVAFLPSSEINSSATEPKILVVVGIKNKLKAKNFAEQMKNKPGYKLQESQYQGVTISQITNPQNNQINSVILGNVLVLAETRKSIENAIDTFKGKTSYSQKAGVKEALSEKLNIKNPLVQVYLPDYAGMIQETLKNAPESSKLSPETLKKIEKVKSVVMGFGLEENGVHFQAISKFDPSLFPQPFKDISGKIIEKFPQDTIAFLNGQGINKAWSELVNESQNNSDLKTVTEAISNGLKTVNLKADTEVFGWMDGEFALGIIPTNQGVLANLGMGGVMLWETGDRQTAQNTLQKLNKMSGGFISVKTNNIKGTEVTEWTSPQQQVVLSYGWLNNNSLVITLGTPLNSMLETQPNNSLSSSTNFKDITKSFPQKNLGYFYLDLEQFISKIRTLPQMQQIPLTTEADGFLNSLQGIAVTGTMPDASTSQMDLVLSLKPSK